MEDDITFDFSKFFKKGKKKKKESKKEDELDIDPKAALSFIKNNAALLLLLIPIIFGFYLRTMPDRLEITDDFAASNVNSAIRSQIRAEINQQFPNLPEQTKQQLTEERYLQFSKQNSQYIADSIKQSSLAIKERFKDEKGYTYLGDIDSYFWMRYAKNILDHGHPGDELKDGKPFDNHMVAPNGLPVQPNMYPYIEAMIHRILTILIPGITLMQSAFYTPLVLSTFAIIAAFFVGKQISGNMGGFFAAIMTAAHPTIISRTLGSDNDIVNIFFPFMIMWLFMIAYDAKSTKKLVFAGLTGIAVGVYSYAWSGYWYLFYFLVGTMATYIGYKLIFDSWTKKNIVISQETMSFVFMLIIFLITTFASIWMVLGTREVMNIPQKPFQIFTLKVASRSESLWPNVYTTVAELNEASLGEIISNVGGNLFLVLAFLGIILTLVDVKKNLGLSLGYIIVSTIWFVVLMNYKSGINLMWFLVLMWIPISAGIILTILQKYEVDIKYAIVLLMWFSATIYASTKGVRFILLILPAFIMGLSLFIGKAYKILEHFISGELQLSKSLAQLILIAFLALLFIQPVRSGYRSARSYVPHINDKWVESLSKINAESEQDAIINSWWDFGHWFKALADRRVTSDGASQNSPQAHWVGKVLLTDDENEAIGILRMLDCSANDAFSNINTEFNDNLKTKNLLDEVIQSSKSKARRLLEDAGIENTDEILELTHCEPPEDYFITSEDMVGKSGVWAHFGVWNFKHARIYSYFTSKEHYEFVQALVDEFDYTEDAAEQTYYDLQSMRTDRQVNDWIASWPSYGGGAGCARNENMLQCNVGLQNQVVPIMINLTTSEAFVQSQNGILHPNSFGYYVDDEYEIKEYDENLMGFSIALRNESNNYGILVMSPELVGSMFTRLFYFNGKGLDHFDKFHDVRDVTGARIITWKVDWDG